MKSILIIVTSLLLSVSSVVYSGDPVDEKDNLVDELFSMPVSQK